MLFQPNSDFDFDFVNKPTRLTHTITYLLPAPSDHQTSVVTVVVAIHTDCLASSNQTI